MSTRTVPREYHLRLTTLAGLALALTVTACGGDKSPTTPSTPPPPPAPTVASVAVTGTGTGTLNRPGQSAPLRANATMSDGTVQDVTGIASWTSSNPGIASVQGGTVSAVSNGDATITATHGGRSGQIQVRVAMPTRGDPRVIGDLTVTISPEALFLYRARLGLTVQEQSGVYGLNVNFINVQWRDYTGANMGSMINYNPAAIAEVWGNNHVGAGQSRSLGPRIDYTRAVSRVSVATTVSVGDDLGNQFNFADTFVASITLRPVILDVPGVTKNPVIVNIERTSDDTPRP